jgi:microcystin-dependent protein
MAKRRPYTLNPSTGAKEFLPTADTLDAKVNVSGPNKILGRTTTGEGGHDELTIGGLVAETAPAAGDFLLIEVDGVLKKLDIEDLPGGGGSAGGDIVGQIKILAHDTLPDRHLWCDGAEISRTTYADLFSAIGTAFGVGDGTTTFNLPDMQDRYVVGASLTKDLASYIGSETVVLTSGNLPAHTHAVNIKLTDSGPTDEGDGTFLYSGANIFGATTGDSGDALAETTSGSAG